MDDRTLERRLEAKDKLIAELLEALDHAANWGKGYKDSTGIEPSWIMEAEEAIRKHKGD